MKTQIILPLFAIGLAMTSCKKEYTCDCTTTDTYTDNGVTTVMTYNNTSKAYGAKMSKKQAQAACDAEAPAIQSNYYSLIDNLGATLDNETINTSCKLK